MNISELSVDKIYVEDVKNKVEFIQGVFSNKINLEPNIQGNMSAYFREIWLDRIIRHDEFLFQHLKDKKKKAKAKSEQVLEKLEMKNTKLIEYEEVISEIIFSDEISISFK
ncbi:10262_t:CDS:2, partial [Funneliformis caledonium]